jgi:glycosyltransferase involved in cell wall biosynthesis
MKRRGLRIAILGTRGVPPRYGGFETFAAELGTRLVERGHEVTVYCRRELYQGEPAVWRGIRRVELRSVRHKYLETVSHSFVSALHAIGESYDVVLLCNAANAFVVPLMRAARMPVAVNVDGIERKRKKWNALGRAVYFAGEALSASSASRVVADAEVIADYYRRTFGIEPEVIGYGAEFPDEHDSDVMERLGIEARKYLLYVSRFEPENNPVAVRDAYSRVRSDLPLVMVGDAPYAPEIRAEMARTSDRRILLPGALYGADYRTLQRNALLYIQATEVGGTHPAMIEAMAAGGAVVANDTPENREVGGGAVLFFRLGSEETLSRLVRQLIDSPAEVERLRPLAAARARERYCWDSIASAYETMLEELAGAGPS